MSRPLLLADEQEMPEWMYDILTERQTNETTSPLWRWRALIAAVDLPGPTKAVALWLAWHCRRDQLFCNPSTTMLAAESGFTRRTVEKAVKTLENRGFLYVQRSNYRNDKRRKNNVYAPAWPEYYEPADTGELCREPGHRGKPCRRPAGWGVEGADGGPCKYHVATTEPVELTDASRRMRAGDALRTAGESHGVGQESPVCRAGESHKRTKNDLSEGSKKRPSSAAKAERHALLVALLEQEQGRSEEEGLSDWSSELNELLEVEKRRAVA